MAWSASTTSDSLTLTSSWQTVQESSADMEITLNSRETAVVMLKYDPQASPTDTLEVAFPVSVDDGTEWESDAHALQVEMDNGTDPGSKKVEISGCETFRIRARLTGSTDTTSTLVVKYQTDGVSV